MSTWTKVAFVAGLAVGYVLGTRAGRERYEQLAKAARSFRESPTVQETAGIVQAQATNMMASARDRVASAVADSGVAEKLAHSAAGEKLAKRFGINGVPQRPSSPN